MFRTRTQGGFIDKTMDTKSWDSPNPEPTGTTTVTTGVGGTFVIMTDNVTPGFSRARNRGQIINSPMSRNSETRTMGLGTILYQISSGGVVHSLKQSDRPLGFPYGLDSYLWKLPSTSMMTNEVRTRALANVKRPDYAGLVSLGELRESLSYLRNPLKTGLKLAGVLEHRIGSLYRKTSYTPKRGALHRDDSAIVKELENLYLEFRYGVRPMIGEVTSFLENFRDKHLIHPRPDRQTFRARQEQRDALDWSESSIVLGGEILCDITYHVERTTTVSAGLLYEYTSDYGLGDKWGLTLGQVPATAWALTPLSFVVDWAFNTSQFLAAITPVAGANRLAEWLTTREEIVVTRQITKHVWPSPWGSVTAAGTRGLDSVHVVRYSRSPYIGLPSLAVKANVLTTLSDSARQLDLAALFHQRVGNSARMAKEVVRRTGRAHDSHLWFG